MFDPNAAYQSLGMLRPSTQRDVDFDNRIEIYKQFQQRITSFVPIADPEAYVSHSNMYDLGGTQLRGPDWNPTATDLYGWHHDCGLKAFYVALWSNQNPTEVHIVETGEIKIPEPYEIILIKNTRCLHRCPPGAYDSGNGRSRVLCVARIHKAALRP